MADPKGFLKTTDRELPARRPVPVRIMDWKEVYESGDSAVLRRQAGRCMDCGIPFCHQGCPLGNLIPEWNDLTWRGEGRSAIERLHATNNFPEFTGRLCPAPCESSCVLGINQPAVTIKQIEVSIADEAFAQRLGRARAARAPDRQDRRRRRLRPRRSRGRPAADARRPHRRRLRARRPHRRTAPLRHPGLQDGEEAPRGAPSPDARRGHALPRGRHDRRRHLVERPARPLRRRRDRHRGHDPARAAPSRAATSRACTSRWSTSSSRTRPSRAIRCRTRSAPRASTSIVIGGGDTGADCIGTAHRQGALSVTNLAIGMQPATSRPEHQPWPMDPTVFEVSSAHEEGGERMYLASTVEFLSNGAGEVRSLRVAETEYVDGRRVPKSGTEREIPADLVLIAMGFTGPERTRARRAARPAVHRRAATSSATTGTRRRSPASSSPATPGAVSRSSSGRSRRAAPPPRTSTRS